MITLYEEDSFEHRMLEMVARHAPRLIRAGGGPLAREAAPRATHPHKMTVVKRERAMELARTGKYTGTQIAEMIGATQSAVFKHMRRCGITLPDGRVERHKLRLERV